ncbi:hypothetical protein B0H19DRAFT_681313 [Mycena capillaripes]|nr:hypothetical protein B0H19DRAFT_681313 [Mycena capillaripes]
MTLPQELVDIIIDNLHDDLPSLKSCSLAARTFVTSARIHIFRKIEILPPPKPLSSRNLCQRFHKLLTSSPHIAPLVEELSVVLVGSETSFAYDDDGVYLEKRHVTWIMTCRTLPLILPLLNLKRISLTENAPVDWNNAGDFSMNWAKMGRQMKSALVNVFSSPRLEAVHLRGIVVESPRLLLSLFSQATSLKKLALSRFYFTQQWDQREPWPESQPWRPQLQSLLVADVQSDNFCCYLVNPRIDLTAVASLTVVTDSSEWRDKIIQATRSGSGGVQHLRIWYMRMDWSHELLSSNLRSIHFFSRSIFWLLNALLKACPHDMCIELIVLETNGRMYNPVKPELEATIESAAARLRFLKTVEFKAILIESTRFHTFDQWETAVRAAVPSLVRRGMLRVTEAQWSADDVHHGWE